MKHKQSCHEGFNLKSLMHEVGPELDKPSLVDALYNLNITLKDLLARMPELISTLQDLQDSATNPPADSDQEPFDSMLSDVCIDIQDDVVSRSNDLLSNIADQLHPDHLGSDLNESDANCIDQARDNVVRIRGAISGQGETNEIPDMLSNMTDILNDIFARYDIPKVPVVIDEEEYMPTNKEKFNLQEVINNKKVPGIGSGVKDKSPLSILVADLSLAHRLIKQASNGGPMEPQAILTLIEPSKYQEIPGHIQERLMKAYSTIKADVEAQDGQPLEKRAYRIQKHAYYRIDDRPDYDDEFYVGDTNTMRNRYPSIPYNYKKWLQAVGETHHQAMARLDEHKNPLNVKMKLRIPDGETSNPIRDEVAGIETRLMRVKANTSKAPTGNTEEQIHSKGKDQHVMSGEIKHDPSNIDKKLDSSRVTESKLDEVGNTSYNKRLMDKKHEEIEDSTPEARFEREEEIDIETAYDHLLSEWRNESLKDDRMERKSSSTGMAKQSIFGGGLKMEQMSSPFDNIAVNNNSDEKVKDVAGAPKENTKIEEAMENASDHIGEARGVFESLARGEVPQLDAPEDGSMTEEDIASVMNKLHDIARRNGLRADIQIGIDENKKIDSLNLEGRLGYQPNSRYRNSDVSSISGNYNSPGPSQMQPGQDLHMGSAASKYYFSTGGSGDIPKQHTPTGG